MTTDAKVNLTFYEPKVPEVTADLECPAFLDKSVVLNAATVGRDFEAFCAKESFTNVKETLFRNIESIKLPESLKASEPALIKQLKNQGTSMQPHLIVQVNPVTGECSSTLIVAQPVTRNWFWQNEHIYVVFTAQKKFDPSAVLTPKVLPTEKDTLESAPASTTGTMESSSSSSK